MVKISLCLMGEKGLYSLEKTIEEFGPDKLYWVVSARDKTIENDYYNAIQSCCKKNSIRFYEKSKLLELRTEVLIAISWRWIIPNSISNLLIILHDSLLPKYRGFAPLVNQLINGEKEIGVSALFANENYDCGDIILQNKILISYPIKIEQAIKLIRVVYFEILKKIFYEVLSERKLIARKQIEDDATYSLWRDENDYRINWEDDSERICRFIDAVGPPYSGAYTLVQKNKIIIHDAIAVKDLAIENRTPGKVIFFNDDFPVVVCGKGLLMITKAEYSNSKKTFLPVSKFRIKFL